MRDIYDTYFFAKNGFELDYQLIEKITDQSAKEVLTACLARVEESQKISALTGLGELLSEKEKYFVKEKLRDEVTFYLKNYLSILN